MQKEKGSIWVLYQLALPGDLSRRANMYMDINNAWTYNPNICWLPMWERDIGTPNTSSLVSDHARNINAPGKNELSFWAYDTASKDNLNQTVGVYARETPQALLLYSKCHNGGDNKSGATLRNAQLQNEASASINLPSSFNWSLMNHSGTLGPTITSVWMQGGEGIVLVKTTGSY